MDKTICQHTLLEFMGLDPSKWKIISISQKNFFDEVKVEVEPVYVSPDYGGLFGTDTTLDLSGGCITQTEHGYEMAV